MWIDVVWIPEGLQVVFSLCGIGGWWKRSTSCVREFTLGVTFRNVEDHFTWVFAGVFGPNADRDRRLIWDELVGLLSW
jgi:hypothetical protein